MSDLPIEPAELLQSLKGKKYDADVAAKVTKAFPNVQLRVIRPGGMITMDMRPERLNIELDNDDYITKVWWG
jgi:hypothetical protein